MMKTISYTYSAKWKHGYIVPLFSVSYYCKKVPIASVPLIILLCFVCSSFFVCCLICVHRAGWKGSPTVPVLNEIITLMWTHLVCTCVDGCTSLFLDTLWHADWSRAWQGWYEMKWPQLLGFIALYIESCYVSFFSYCQFGILRS